MCSPIRSLIESGFSATKRSDVRLYYGARNLKRMAYQVGFGFFSPLPHKFTSLCIAMGVYSLNMVLKLLLLPLIG